MFHTFWQAITGDSIKRRCEMIQISLHRHLVQLQTMVPVVLASQVVDPSLFMIIVLDGYVYFKYLVIRVMH